MKSILLTNTLLFSYNYYRIVGKAPAKQHTKGVSTMADDADYRRAANAVQSGSATKEQRELNDKMAKQAGSMGNDARAAQEGRKTW